MKKLLFMFAGLALLFTACNMAIPESVSVKTDADYNFSIGDIKKDLREDFDVSKVFKDLDGIYDYNPDQKSSELQQFILKVETPEIPLGVPKSLTPEAGEKLSKYLPDFSFHDTVHIDMNIQQIFESFKVLGDDFADKVDFEELPLYVYCNIGSGFSKVTMTGKIKAGSTYIIGEDSTFVSFPLYAAPVLENVDGNPVAAGDTVITNVSSLPYTAHDEKNMATFLKLNKNTETGFDLTYYIDIDTNKTYFDGNSIEDISFSIFIGLPLKFKVSEGSDLAIDIAALAKKNSGGTSPKDKDIFGRDKATDITDIKKYLDVMEEVLIGYKNKKNLINTDDGYYLIDSTRPKFHFEPKITQGEITIKHDDFMLMISEDCYPYEPTVNIVIPKGTLVSLPRDIELNINTYVKVSTNGTIKF